MVFAIWAGTGFGYPVAALPTVLNIVAKLLSFGVVLTLFLPRRCEAVAGAAGPSVTAG